MATIETDIDIKALKSSGLRGGKLLDYAFNVLGYDGEKLAHVAIHVGTPHVNHIHAASMLDRSVSTIRNWASQGDGPIHPKVVNKTCCWRMRDIRSLIDL